MTLADNKMNEMEEIERGADITRIFFERDDGAPCAFDLYQYSGGELVLLTHIPFKAPNSKLGLEDEDIIDILLCRAESKNDNELIEMFNKIKNKLKAKR